MLYRNCHYRYKNKICQLTDFFTEISNSPNRVKVHFRNGSEVICSENDLEEIPLTDSILQSCYKMKTIVRDGEWDIIWNLGGENNVTIGEKQGQFFLLPSTDVETVVEILPFEIVQGHCISGGQESVCIRSVSDLERVFPELADKTWKYRERV